MGAYEYKALNADGKSVKGILEGDTAKHVRQNLREQQLLPVEVQAIDQRRDRTTQTSTPQRGQKMGAMDLAIFTRQLATLVRAGLPIDECLSAIGKQTDNSRIKRIALGARSDIAEGRSLAKSFERFPKAFPEIYRATVAAGEKSGHLEAVLERLADYAEERQVLNQKISHAMVYPILLTVVAVAIVVFLLVVMVPKVVAVYSDANRDLPALTQMMIAMSDFIKNHYIVLIVGILGLIIAASRLKQHPKIRPKLHRFWLRLPIVGHLIRGLNTARFTRTLSILSGSGVPVLEALRISGKVIANEPMRAAVKRAALKVREGGSIARSLDESKLFPAITIHLISSGEASGQLEDMLSRAAVNQEREMNATISTLLAILEPALILVMGMVVLVIVLSILLPILDINSLFS